LIPKHLAARAAAVIVASILGAVTSSAAPPDDFPRFIVPGHEAEMESLRNLFWLHYQTAGPRIALWDEWLANSTLWPAVGAGPQLDAMRQRWAQTLSARPLDADGYVLTQQHDGPAHAEGWPFPTWMQAGGIGWQFRPIGIAGYDPPPATPQNWKLEHAKSGGIDGRGWRVELVEPEATLQTPEFEVSAKVAPWLRLNWWATGLHRAKCYVEWATKDEPKFSNNRRIYFDPPADSTSASARETRTMIPVYRDPAWRGAVTGIRIGFANAGPAQVTIKSFHTSSDTRQNVNNLNYIRGCHDYFLWTHDVDFLRKNTEKIRTAFRFVEHEFQTREKKCIYTTWPGHEGRSGVVWEKGKKRIILGQGIGSNYWDLLPFGGEDALATVYYYDTLRKLAELETQIAKHPEWKVPAGDAYAPADLLHQAEEVKGYFDKRFWNPETGRFGTIDLDGRMHDYGFTFLNNEAVTFGVASNDQVKSIESWMSGARTVAGDTSTGSDIYHWRFGPRATTRRNIDYYFWGWSNPESVPWGAQVQDGGAVLGFTYYDLMARLKTAGPDDIAPRLEAIAGWFDETQREGGYRAYYSKDPARGSLQGGGTAGGLGLDREFVESVMATQVMLYGVLGFHPTVDGFAIAPKLPSDWPELTITRIHLRDQVLDVTATGDGGLKIVATRPAAREMIVHASSKTRLESASGVKVRIVKDR
jgi:hypothetical protein